MGRLRNLSLSLKAAAFQSSSANSSPVNTKTTTFASDNQDPQSPSTQSPTAKEVPTLTREATSSSVFDNPDTSRRLRSSSTRVSQVYEPPTMATGREESIEELKPVFSFLSSHQNKLYQEGYFLKLSDLDTNGKPNADRNWTECFAQLVGTVLSLWDAAALDAAGQDGEVSPTFVNLVDASIKMIETLPTRNREVEPLQNVLSVSTAGKNRYLLHFNSLHALTQWTASIRLSMFEHTSLQELYTGSLIAGKGKTLNNIRTIMQQSKFVEEDWCRVRFGAGTPWRRCWYVIEPPDEKEWQKANKSLKKRGTYERVSLPKGDLKFYDKKKSKKATPIATITDVYSAYAVYPQSKPLIEQSTLVKLEGKITIHSKPESTTEGFVFVMPEVHPAVSGFEILLRFLFPIYDTFTLYGRPGRLIADALDARGLMFAMPKDRRYGYLDIIDVAGLIHTDGSDKWSEREWRKQTRELISRRLSMTAQGRTSESHSNGRRSLGSRPGIRFGEPGRLSEEIPNQSTDAVFKTPEKTYTTPVAAQSTSAIKTHSRSVSETLGLVSPSKRRSQQQQYVPSKLSAAEQEVESPTEISPPPLPPTHRKPLPSSSGREHDSETARSTNSSDGEFYEPRLDAEELYQDLAMLNPPTPVGEPTFNHQATDQPSRRPRDRPDLRREKSRMSSATLSQLVDASRNSVGSGGDAGAAAAAAWSNKKGNTESQSRGVNTSYHPDDLRREANYPTEVLMTDIVEPTEYRGIARQKSVARTISQSSVRRKPLPVDAKVTPPLPTTSSPAKDLNTAMDDRESTSDYASIPETKSPEKLRKLGGVRKTIGNPAYDSDKAKADIPDIDFGVTQSLKPDSGGSISRPSTAGRVSPLPPHSRTPSGPRTPQDERSYFERVSPLQDRSRPSSQHWTPGSSPAGGSSPNALSPEEFVQQRAATNRPPYGHMSKRSQSTGRPEEVSSRPMTSPSARKLPKNSSSRPNSSHERSLSARLSAREQEHVARLTGGPLLHVSDRSRTPDPSIGLVGAIEAREQEKRNVREGVSNQLVQAEVARRHQQAQMQYMQQMQSLHSPQNFYAQQNIGYYGPQQFPVQQQSQYSASVSYPQQQQQQQQPPYYQPQQFPQQPHQSAYNQNPNQSYNRKF